MKKFICFLLLACSLCACSSPKVKDEQTFTEGTFKGKAVGNNGDLVVDVTFKNNLIESVEVVDHKETPGIADPALKNIPEEIVKNQSLAVDMVSGATNTSKAIVDAVSDAVKQANGNLDLLTTKNVAKSNEVLDMETDVVVVGGGSSGSASALKAIQSGAKVILLEKAAGVSGAGSMAGVLFADHSSLQKEENKEVDSKWLYDQYINDSNYNANARLVSKVIENSSETVDWLIENGVELTLLDAGYGAQYNHIGMPTTAHGYKEGGSVAIGNIHKKIEELGGQVLYETSGMDIIVEDGKVSGVVASKKDGTKLNIKAKSVILATGGFGGNKEMMEEHFGEKAGVGLVSTASGDGLKMAWSVGAAKFGENVAQWFGMKYDSEKAKNMPNGTSDLNKIVRNPLLFTDIYGNRFGNEEEAYESAALGTMMYNLPEAKMMVVLDQGILDQVATRGLADVFVDRWANFYGKNVSYIENGKERNLDKDTDELRTPRDFTSVLDQAVEAGIAYKADTLEDLSKVANLPNLLETVETYNKMCEENIDSQFYKDPKFLNPVAKGPFYVVETRLRCLGTLGGVKINEDMQAVDEFDKPIDNLYVVGADAGGMYGNSYVMFEGGTLGFSYISGKVAGENAALNALK